MNPEEQRYIRIHPKFKLNGRSYSIDALRRLAHDFIEVGEPYEESVGTFLLDWLNDKRYVTVRTSGSTGAPKVIKIKKWHMVNSAKATAKHFSLAEKTTALLCLPADFIAGKMMLVRALVLGWHIDMTQPKSNPLDNVYRRYDFCAMTPFQLDNSLSRMHLLSKLIVGGGAISANLKQRIANLSTKVYETYGMTETVTHIAARRVNPKKPKETPIPFKALAKVTINQDERGCLVIKAPAVSSDPVITNDLVEILTYKKFIWLGRVDNVKNSGGIKLYPEQIEQKLAQFIEATFFIAGVPDDALGQRVALFVEQEKDFYFNKDEVSLEIFSAYEFPKSVYTIDRFERTENGKIKRGQTTRKVLNL
jgi:O-succinylbenzoic acid--CoA ligase